ncbi:Leucine-rich repeat-containing N-terminal, plant-type [Sesbania bispinosa]|nr:Leucine-rich repeat-containing N-terminal, plant-type [Sesbania bispinosa]
MGHVAWMLLVIATTVFCPSSLALPQDGLTLLEIKSTLNDTRNFLSNWQESDESHCTWTGITCHPGEQRVRSINLPYMQLGGIISPSIGKLSRLHRLKFKYRDLSSNSLKGAIPSSIGRLTHLRAL